MDRTELRYFRLPTNKIKKFNNRHIWKEIMEEYFLQQNAAKRKVSRQDSKIQRDDLKNAKNDEQFSRPGKALAVFEHAVRRVIVIYR